MHDIIEKEGLSSEDTCSQLVNDLVPQINLAAGCLPAPLQPGNQPQYTACSGDGIVGDDACSLNPEASPFKVRDPRLVHHGQLVPDLAADWEHVRRVQLGGVGDQSSMDQSL